MKWKDIDRLLLVGGSTRMPMVGNMLRQMSGLEPDRTVNPDEAVARGAALYAGYLLAKESGDKRTTAVEITNVNSHSLGVEGIDPITLRKKNVILIPRNTPLPAKATERFTTKSENQRSIMLKVLEGESTIPGECTAIGRTAIRNLPAGLTKGWPIDVTFEYGSNGRLNVHAVVPGTSHEAKLDLERDSGMTRESIEHWKHPIGEAAGFNSFESMLQDVLGIGTPLASTTEAHEVSPLPTNLRSAPGEEPGVRAEAVKPATSSAFVSNAEEPLTFQPVETIIPATLADRPADSPFPQRRPGASALRTFAAKPQTLADAAPIWEEEENITVDRTVEFLAEKPAEKSVGKPVAGRISVLRVLFKAIGFIIFSAFGLALGYVILHYIMPDEFKWPW